MGIFHDFFARNYLSISKITWKMALSLKLPIKYFFFNTVHNLITRIRSRFSTKRIRGRIKIDPHHWIKGNATKKFKYSLTFLLIKFWSRYRLFICSIWIKPYLVWIRLIQSNRWKKGETGIQYMYNWYTVSGIIWFGLS